MSTKTEKLESIAKEIFPNATIRYGRTEICCADPETNTVPYGYTLYPGTGWQKDIRFLGESFVEALDELERIGIDMATVRCACFQ